MQWQRLRQGHKEGVAIEVQAVVVTTELQSYRKPKTSDTTASWGGGSLRTFHSVVEVESGNAARIRTQVTDTIAIKMQN